VLLAGLLLVVTLLLDGLLVLTRGSRTRETSLIAAISSALVGVLVAGGFAGAARRPMVAELLRLSPAEAGLAALAVMLLYWVQNTARRASNFEMGCVLAILLLLVTGVALVAVTMRVETVVGQATAR
jgi:hypothetical protein